MRSKSTGLDAFRARIRNNNEFHIERFESVRAERVNVKTWLREFERNQMQGIASFLTGDRKILATVAYVYIKARINSYYLKFVSSETHIIIMGATWNLSYEMTDVFFSW